MGDFLEYRTQKQYEELKEPYTPTTEEVRHAILYVVERLEYQGHPLPGGVEGFDRWLASVKAEAWDKGERHESEYLSTWGQFCPHKTCNPYREVSK